VSIRVRVPATAAAGQEIEYHLYVENSSAAPAHHVLVRNPLPSNARYVRASPEPFSREAELVWKLNTLEAGGRREIVLVLAPTNLEDVNNCARVQFEHGQCVATKIAKPSLQLRKEGPEQALLNDILSYRITVTNTGSSPLTKIMVTDVLPQGLSLEGGKSRPSFIVDTLKPGQSQSFEYKAIAKMTGRWCNKAIVTAEGGVKEEKESCVTVAEAKLGLNVEGPKQRYLNMPARYMISVSNAGTATLNKVVITNPLPAGVSLQSASEGGQRSTGQVQWSLGSLEPGASKKLEIVLQAQSAGRICNKVEAQAEPGLNEKAETCTDFAGLSALSLEVEDSEDPVEVGGTTTFSITVRNQGSKPATGLSIVATVPEQLEVIRAAGAADNHKDGRKIVYNALTLRAGGEARYRVEARALRPGDVRFKVELTADVLTAGPVLQEESTTIYAALPVARRKPGK
jgi:uncharacterized repeat protein (TIGR01451 family)